MYFVIVFGFWVLGFVFGFFVEASLSVLMHVLFVWTGHLRLFRPSSCPNTLLNKPGLEGAVLQTPWSLIKSVTE